MVGLGRVGRYIQTHNFEFWTAQRTDSAAATAAAAAAPGVETKRNQRRSQNQPTRYYDQAPAMNWDHAVSWGWGVWVSVSDIGRVGRWVGLAKTKPNQRRTQNQPTRYYDQAPQLGTGITRSAGVGGFGLALAILVGLGRVGSGWPTGIETIPSGHSR